MIYDMTASRIHNYYTIKSKTILLNNIMHCHFPCVLSSKIVFHLEGYTTVIAWGIYG